MISGERLRLVEWRREREGELPEDCDEVPIERWDRDRNGEYVTPSYFVSGDYIGEGALGRSNRRVLLDELAEFCGKEFWPVYGSYSYSGVVFRRDADERVPEIRELFERLNGYSVLDEDDWSELEMEEERDDWDNYGRGDFRRWLTDDGQAYLPEMVRLLVLYQYGSGGAHNLWHVLRELPVDFVVDIAEHVTGVEEEELSGFDPESNSFTDWASMEDDRVIDKFWYDLMAVGGGSGEVEHTSEGTHFDFKHLFGAHGYRKPEFDEELAERSWNAARQILLAPPEKIAWPSASTMGVLIDHLLERDGDWDAFATKILKAKA